METIIGTMIGGIIAGTAMIINSYYSSKNQTKVEDRAFFRAELKKDIAELDNLYEKVLHITDKIIRDLGMASDSDLENFYQLDVKLDLKSNEKVISKFKKLRSEIATMATNLPKMPDEFIPKFEEDHHRYYRLEEREKAKIKRKKKADEYLPNIRKLHEELIALMKKDLKEKKSIPLDEYIKNQNSDIA